MSDIFNEVDEEVRRERLKQMWERYGGYVVGLALLIVIGVGGWRGYQWYQAKQAAAAGAVFEAAVTLASEGKHDEAEAAFARIANEGTAYRVLARLRQASELALKDPPGAVKLYDGLVADSGVEVPMQDLARVRATMLLVDTASFDEVRTRLEPATADGRVFRHSAREMLMFAAWKAGNQAATKQWADALTRDPETPVGIRTRTEMLMALPAPDARS
ncbi:MAG: tetratricopeptide repeat protein [Variibacter sp.]|nr:tetratricopeptide repeat protein [Variibacter sp.]